MQPLLPDQGSELANDLTSLIIVIIIAIIMLFIIRHNTDKEFEKWFKQVVETAPYFGQTQEQINAFEEMDWFEDFTNGLSPEEAIKKKLNFT